MQSPWFRPRLLPVIGAALLLACPAYPAIGPDQIVLVVNKNAPEGLRIARSAVGNYVTSLDMAGCSLTVTKLDAEMARLWDARVHTAALRWGM